MNEVHVEVRPARHLGVASAYENRHEILLVVECHRAPMTELQSNGEVVLENYHDLAHLVEIEDPDLRERASDLARLGSARLEYVTGHLLIHLSKVPEPHTSLHDEVIHFG